MKNNKGQGPLLLHHRRAAPTRKAKFEEDADKVVAYYRDHGYISARVSASPSSATSRTRPTGRTRWVELRDPGHRGRAVPGRRPSSFDGNKVVKSEALRPLFKVKDGRLVQRQGDPEGLREGARTLRRRRLLPVQPGAVDAAAHRGDRHAGAAQGTDGAAAAEPGRRAARRRPDRTSRSPPRNRRPGPRPPRRRGPASKLPTGAPLVDVSCRCTKASSTSSTGSPSSGTRRRATTSSGARSGSSRTASSTPRR